MVKPSRCSPLESRAWSTGLFCCIWSVLSHYSFLYCPDFEFLTSNRMERAIRWSGGSCFLSPKRKFCLVSLRIRCRRLDLLQCCQLYCSPDCPESWVSNGCLANFYSSTKFQSLEPDDVHSHHLVRNTVQGLENAFARYICNFSRCVSIEFHFFPCSPLSNFR